MIIDKRLQVSAQQALTATARSTDVIDLGTVRLIGPGEPLWWVIAARTGLAGTTPTFKVDVETDDNASFSSGVVLVSSAVLSAFATGSRLVIPMAFTNERYLSLNYTLGGTTPTVTVDAWLTNQDPTIATTYPDAI